MISPRGTTTTEVKTSPKLVADTKSGLRAIWPPEIKPFESKPPEVVKPVESIKPSEGRVKSVWPPINAQN